MGRKEKNGGHQALNKAPQRPEAVPEGAHRTEDKPVRSPVAGLRAKLRLIEIRAVTQADELDNIDVIFEQRLIHKIPQARTQLLA